MRSAGDWALTWANNHVNGLVWDDIVEGIREEAVDDYTSCTVDDEEYEYERQILLAANDDEGTTRP
jgi:hypothetical protein